MTTKEKKDLKYLLRDHDLESALLEASEDYNNPNKVDRAMILATEAMIKEIECNSNNPNKINQIIDAFLRLYRLHEPNISEKAKEKIKETISGL
jgi:hypothetical protein